MDGYVVAYLLAGLLVTASFGSFFVSPDTSATDSVSFDSTIAMGMTIEERLELGEDRFIPRAQVMYSQYPYVVGYRGLGLAGKEVDDPLVHQQFGYPQTVYVEAASSDVTLDDDGFLVGSNPGTWIPAEEAYFVVETPTRLPSGPTPVAFEERSAATSFADRYDGRVVGWDGREAFAYQTRNASSVRKRVDDRHLAADATVERAREATDRPTETVLTPETADLQTAMASAPPNTTVRLRPGTYEGPVDINRSVTVVGEDAHIVGDGNGTVVTIRADDVALVGVDISGVGETMQPDDIDAEGWDARTEKGYGHADAGVTVAASDRTLLRDVRVETPTSGVILRDANGTVIDGLRVEGTDEWQAGFMGVATIRSPAVVQNSTFVGGRDGVYTHRSEGIVVRNNRFFGGRFGTHLMYTSDALVSNNCATGQDISGIVIMTDPSGVAVTDNVLADAGQGILTSGTYAYIGHNIVVGGRQGISTNARNSLYERNTVVGNERGFRAASIIPSSVVTRNDIVDNHEPVRARTGPLRVWGDGDDGNYWSGAKRLDRPYVPSDPIDGRLHRNEAAYTLSLSPGVRGLRVLRGSVPGMRTASVVDPAPRKRPVDASRLETAKRLANATDVTDEWGCSA